MKKKERKIVIARKKKAKFVIIIDFTMQIVFTLLGRQFLTSPFIIAVDAGVAVELAEKYRPFVQYIEVRGASTEQ